MRKQKTGTFPQPLGSAGRYQSDQQSVILQKTTRRMTESSNPVVNGAAPNARPESAIVSAISTMSDLLVSSLASLKTSMTESFEEMKESLDQLVIEEGLVDLEENAEQLPTQTAERGKQSDNNQQFGSTVSMSTVEKSQKSETTVQSINSLINQNSESQRGQIDLLSGIANDLKLDQKKAPAVNEQIAKIVHGLMREKLSDEVLTEKQNHYNRPENCDCLIGTKVKHLIWDKLKPDTRSNDIKLQ